MGFRSGAYATIWQVEPVSNTFTKARISISRKNKNTGSYETDFSGYVSFSGTTAASKASGLKEKDRIQIGDCDTRSKYDAEKKMTYYNFIVYSFEMANGLATQPSPKQSSSPQIPEVDNGEIDDSLLPF